jgi:hypothetical protein
MPQPGELRSSLLEPLPIVNPLKFRSVSPEEDISERDVLPRGQIPDESETEFSGARCECVQKLEAKLHVTAISKAAGVNSQAASESLRSKSQPPSD